MAEGIEVAVVPSPHEASQAAPRDVFEEDPLHRVAGAEAKDFVPFGLDEVRRHGAQL
jgi:hypothetical protein